MNLPMKWGKGREQLLSLGTGTFGPYPWPIGRCDELERLVFPACPLTTMLKSLQKVSAIKASSLSWDVDKPGWMMASTQRSMLVGISIASTTILASSRFFQQSFASVLVYCEL